MSAPQAARERLWEKAIADPKAVWCKAQRDGECDWEKCPQRINYQSMCPLPHWTDNPDY